MCEMLKSATVPLFPNLALVVLTCRNDNALIALVEPFTHARVLAPQVEGNQLNDMTVVSGNTCSFGGPSRMLHLVVVNYTF